MVMWFLLACGRPSSDTAPPPADTDGQSSEDCSEAIVVESSLDADCDSGALYRIDSPFTGGLPLGDCVCAVEGDLLLGSDEGAGALERVGGTLKIGATRDLSLPELETAGALSAVLEGATLSAPRLREVGDLHLELWDHTPELGALARFDEAFIYSLGEASHGLPAVLSGTEVVAVLPASAQLDLSRWTLEKLDVSLHGRGTQEEPDHARLFVPQVPRLLTHDAGWVVVEVICPPELEEAYLGSNQATFYGLERAGSLYLNGGRPGSQPDGRYRALPDLEEVEHLRIAGGFHDLPALTQVSELLVEHWTPRVAWPQLREIDQVTLDVQVELPTVQSVGALADRAGGSSLSSLVEAGSLECFDTDLPELVEAQWASGRCLAPSLETLGGGDGLEACAGCLDSLRTVTGALGLTGDEAELPALRRAEDTLTLDGVGRFWAPELSSLALLYVTGEGDAVLESPVQGNVRVEQWEPSQPVVWPVIEGNLTIRGATMVHEAPPLTVERVTGSVYLNAQMWVDLAPLLLEQVDGNLRWCLKLMDDQTVLDWLSPTHIGGVSERYCED